MVYTEVILACKSGSFVFNMYSQYLNMPVSRVWYHKFTGQRKDHKHLQYYFIHNLKCIHVYACRGC